MPARPSTLPPPTEKRRYVRRMFTAIAPTYDLLNHVLSFNLDRRWRRRAVACLEWTRAPGGLYLDACAGTFDLAWILASRPGFAGRVVATDFALPMVRRGISKTRHLEVRPAAADALDLPFADARFDGVMVGWGVRNLADLEAGFAELLRVLKPGGRLVVLDSTNPPPSPMRPFYDFYFRRLVPVIGRVVSGHATAYAYLPESVGAFPPPKDLQALMARSGFTGCGHQLLAGGVVAVHWGAR